MSFTPLRRAQFRLQRLMEARALLEWQSFYALRPLLKRFPRGDGHSVVVFPGFMSSDRATRPLRGLLSDLGYKTYGWGLGQNVMFDDSLEEEMVALVNDVYQRSGKPVSLVGWSLGGLYAREVAKACPDKIRGVITLGSPISGDTSHSNANRLFEALNGKPNQVEQSRFLKLNEPPPVPTTSIYSKNDGIVAWEGSVQKRGELTENVEVPASHLGLGVNVLALYVVIDRLAQPESDWQRFDISGFRSLVYRRPNQRQVKRALRTAMAAD